MKGKAAKIFGGLWVVTFILVFAVGTTDALYFSYEIPRTPYAPDALHGFIYPYNNHGMTHYVTRLDHSLDVVTGWVFAICILPLIVSVMLIMAYNYGKDRHL